MNNSFKESIAIAATESSVDTSLFPSEMPVSNHLSGAVASRFGELYWDLSSFSTDGATTNILNFYVGTDLSPTKLTLLIREQHKALMWLHISAGRTRAWVTLYNTNKALLIWCKAAAQKGVDLYTLLSNIAWVGEVAQGLNVNYLDLTSAVLRTLWRNRHQLRAPMNFPLDELRKTLNNEARSHPASRQTPLIPSRVYSAILSALSERMILIEREIDSLDVDETAIPISERFSRHQMTLMLLVAAYTGMRVCEVSILSLEHPIKEFEHMGSKHYEVQGSTHKLNAGIKQRATWITSHEGARAVLLAQRIARLVEPQHVQSAGMGQQLLLFPSSESPYRKLSRGSFNRRLKGHLNFICPVIESADIEELDRLELDRGWARDDIEVGKRWPLAFHQLRRSLAVYAHCSGMVSLPVLKSQLKHITQEMAFYYSSGFSKAVNLVCDKSHFLHEWQAAKAESSYFSYVFGVLFSDDAFFGQGAQRMTRTVEARDRQDTLRLFRQNKLAYQETPLGGCVSTDSCKIDPLEPIPYHCLETNCMNQVVFGKRLAHVIKHQEIAVAILERDDAGSVEHRLEARQLEVLLKASERQKKEARSGCKMPS